MAKRTVTLSLELPVEVAEWLAANAESIGYQAHLAATQVRHNSEEAKQQSKKRSRERQNYMVNLGRVGYRELRKVGVTNNFVKNRDFTKEVAPQLGVTWQSLELAVTRFKRNLEAQLRLRRGREIARMYWAGYSNQQIAERLNIHCNTVDRHMRKVKQLTGRRA